MAKTLAVAAVVVSMIAQDAAFAIKLPIPSATWGNPDQPWGRRRVVTDEDRKQIAAFRSGRMTATYATNFDSPTAFQSDWLAQTDNPSNPQNLSCRRPANVAVGSNGLSLKTLATQDCSKKKWSTGSVWSNFKMNHGFYEARMKIADISGMNNAFWVVTSTYEIDVAEVHYPNQVGISVHNWTGGKDSSVGFRQMLNDNLSADFHDYGVLWTPNGLVMEIDGEPVAAYVTNGSVAGPAQIRFSTALASFAGEVPPNPEGHGMVVKALRVFALSE
jgi:beta-glucanase (GH16 family)